MTFRTRWVYIIRSRYIEYLFRFFFLCSFVLSCIRIKRFWLMRIHLKTLIIQRYNMCFPVKFPHNYPRHETPPRLLSRSPTYVPDLEWPGFALCTTWPGCLLAAAPPVAPLREMSFFCGTVLSLLVRRCQVWVGFYTHVHTWRNTPRCTYAHTCVYTRGRVGTQLCIYSHILLYRETHTHLSTYTQTHVCVSLMNQYVLKSINVCSSYA